MMGFEYAHRGLFDTEKGILENTLAAFENAVKHGYGMELDVQLSRDGVVVVCHDGDLMHVYGKESVIKDLDYAQMPFLPTLEQVLHLVDGQTPIIVELKHYDRIYLLAEKVRDLLKGYQGAYAVESFEFRIVRWFLKNAPEILRGQLISKGFHVCQCLLSKPDFIAVRIGSEKSLWMRLARGLFHPVTVAWTVRTPAQLEAAKACYTLHIFEKTALAAKD